MSGSRRPLVVIGDALLDRDVEGRVERLSPEAPVPVVDEVAESARPGGAGLAAALAAAEDRPVTLITALAADPAGRRLSRELEQAGVRVVDLGLAARTPEKIRIRADGRSLLRVDRGGAERGPVGPPTAAAHEALRSAAGVLVADYGRGVAAEPGMRDAVGALGGTPVVWDPHPRGEAPVAGVTLATPNRAEAAGLIPEI